ncbi:MAG: Trm112 family protein [Verrucomicrobiia bacterium]
MTTQELLEILCCPESHQSLAVAEPALVEKLNAQIAAGQLANRGGGVIREKIDGGFVRADGKILYPIRRGIPVLLIQEGIPLEPR